MQPDIKEKIQSLPVGVQIGKRGLTGSSLEEMKKQIKRHSLLKIKILHANLGEEEKPKEVRKSIIQKILKACPCKLLDLRGNIAVFQKVKPVVAKKKQ